MPPSAAGIALALLCIPMAMAPPPRETRQRERWHRLIGLVRGRRRHGLGRALERLSGHVTDWVGTSWAFALALGVVLVWALTGPLFGFSDTWQLVINTGTTIVTFLMVFLIQRAQNKDARAIHLKLNEIVAALEGASNRLINVEDLTEDEVRLLHRHYARLVALAREGGSLTESHSIEEAAARHALKRTRGAPPMQRAS
jgi:low affinity Fe/Cu permease